MKKVTLFIIAACFACAVFSQGYTLTPLPNQVYLTQSDRAFSGYFPVNCAGRTGDRYFAYIDYNANGSTTILHESASGVFDTMAKSLPFSAAAMKLDANDTLWVAGGNYTTNPDSLIWKSSIAPGSHFQYVAGAPHGVGGLSWSADVETIDFFNGGIYFTGRWDTAGGRLMHNVTEYMAGTFYSNSNYANAYSAGLLTDDVFISKLSAPGDLTLYSPYRGKKVFNLTGAGANGLTLGISGNFPHADNVWYFQNILYVAATDTVAHTQSIMKNVQPGIFDTIATLSGGVTVRDVDTLGGQLLILVNGTVTNLATGDTFFPVMSYNNAQLVPVIKYLADTSTGASQPVVASIHDGVIQGRFNFVDGVFALDFIRLTPVVADVTPPVVTLLGNDTVYVHRTSAYTDAGATAVDNVDGNIAPVIYVNNVNTSVVGEYQVQYKATDHAGNTGYSQIRVVIVTPGTGIQDISPNAKIWSSERNITITGIEGSAAATLYDMSGQVVDEQIFENQIRIDARSYPSGTYLVRVEQQGMSTVKKIAIY